LEFPSRLLSRLTAEPEAAAPASRRPSRDDTDDLTSIQSEIDFARLAKSNVLVVGPDRLVADLLSVLVPDADPDITFRCRSMRLRLPPPSSRLPTIVLRDVDTLSPEQQGRLSDWLNTSATRRQVISTAAVPLLPLVEAGQFSDSLYYRLNTVYIDLFE
jgi:hypothetical protein